MTADIQHQASVRKTGSVFYFNSRQRPVGTFHSCLSVDGGWQQLVHGLYSIKETVGM